MSKEIDIKKYLDYIYNLLDYKPTEEEIKSDIFNISIYLDQDLITEKNIPKASLSKDSYSLGNYYILKEKDSEASMIFWPKNLIEDEMDKQLIEYLNSNKFISLDLINKFYVIYNNIKFKKIKDKFNFNNSLDKYIID